MDFFLGPAVLLLDGEEFGVTAFIDAARDGVLEDWGGYLETGPYGDVLAFQAVDPEDIRIQVPGTQPRCIAIQFIDGDGFSFSGEGSSPLSVAAE